MADKSYRYDLYRGGHLSPLDDRMFLAHSKFDAADGNWNFVYKNGRDPDAENLKARYCIEFLDENDDGITTAVKAMHWTSHKLIADGCVRPPYPLNSMNILNKTEEKHIGSNCWMYATVLNELLLCLGYHSRMVRCMPVDLRFDDCHCVTGFYDDSREQWCVLDAAYNCLYSDSRNIPLSFMELRKRLAYGVEIYDGAGKEITSYVRDSLCKNFYRFQCYSVSMYNMESSSGDKILYNLVPVDCHLTDKHLEYSYKNTKLDILYTHNPDIFFARPE